MFRNLKKLLSILDPRERRRLIWVFASVLSMAIFELLGISSVGPFLAVAAQPSLITSNRYLSWAYTTFGFTSTQSFLVVLGIGVVVFLIARNAFAALTQYVLVRYSQMRVFTLSRRMLASYLGRPYAFFLNSNTSELAKNVLAETSQAITGFLLPWLEVTSNAIVVAFIVGLLVVINPAIAVAAAGGLGVLYGLVFLLIKKRLTALGYERLQANKERYKTTLEALGGIKDVKLLHKEGVFIDEFAKPANKLAKISISRSILGLLPRYVLESVTFTAMILVMTYFIAFTDSVEDIIPTAGLFLFAAYRLRPVLQKLFTNMAKLRSSYAVVDMIIEHLTGEDVADHKHLRRRRPSPMPFEKEIVLSDLSFRYPNADAWVLKDQTFRIAKNTTVGLVGPTGCGKTTTVDIILGLLSPTEGQMLIDGVPVDAKNLEKWQANLGYVPQHIYLGDTSVAQNIAFGVPREEIDMEAVRKAAAIANLDTFIEEELPNKYDTVVGERGVRLSGGQRQRVGIARAVYPDPAVLVLDEATSALDTVTEQAVMEAIDNLAHKKTIIIIAHRISTVQECDNIYVLKKGKIIAEGRYGDLLESSPQFRQMAKV
jgi:ATP-binding cassette, subfamily B, bacterial PglK